MTETAKHVEAFNTYLNMGPKRNLRDLVQKLGKSRATIEKWSKAFNWQERITQAEEEAKPEMEKAGKELFIKNQKKLEEKRNMLVLKMLECLEGKKNDPKYMRMMYDVLRTEEGLPVRILQNENLNSEVLDFRNLSDDEVKKAEKFFSTLEEKAKNAKV